MSTPERPDLMEAASMSGSTGNGAAAGSAGDGRHSS